jgi:exodeoxyribonuclease-1
MKPTFLFYDLETTGLSKTFDQVIQFAGIRTDENLNELERYEYLIQLNPDSIPSPEAIITHRIGISVCEKGVKEIVAMEKIHVLLNTPNTTSIGYNTLGFDDEFLRFSFYRNLLPPYTHQFANQCKRADMYPITLMYYLYQNDSLIWPMIDDRVSLKLENINRENQLAEGQAHDAMVDVEVTLALAKKLKQHSAMWNYLIQYFDKSMDTKRVNQLPTVFNKYQAGVYVEGRIGRRDNFAAPVLCLGQHYHYKNQTVWLRLDAAELRKTTLKDIEKTTWCFSKKYAEPGFLLPPSDKYLSPISEERLLNRTENLAWLEKHPEILEAIAQHHCDFKYPEVANVDVDAALYLNGFLSREETDHCTQFHRVPEQKRAEVVDTIRNTTLRTIALRTLGRTDSALLSDSQRQIFDAYIAKTLSDENDIIDFKGHKKITRQQAIETAKALPEKRELDEQQVALLDELLVYLESDS